MAKIRAKSGARLNDLLDRIAIVGAAIDEDLARSKAIKAVEKIRFLGIRQLQCSEIAQRAPLHMAEVYLPRVIVGPQRGSRAHLVGLLIQLVRKILTEVGQHLFRELPAEGRGRDNPAASQTAELVSGLSKCVAERPDSHHKQRRAAELLCRLCGR